MNAPAVISFAPLWFALNGQQLRAPERPVFNSPIEALRSRDPVEWHELFEREMPAIFRYVSARVGQEAAEDITAHVFAEAWEHASSLEDRGLPARAWLFGIARNVVNNHRRLWVRKPPEISLDGLEREQPATDFAADLMDLASAVRSLPRSQAEVVMLRFVHGLSLHETAAATGATVDSVKARQARALSALRAKLGVREAPFESVAVAQPGRR